jgi:hypothetical protein
VAITEGEPYQLGTVELIGDDLPVDAMLSAAKLRTGKLANWKQIHAVKQVAHTQTRDVFPILITN